MRTLFIIPLVLMSLVSFPSWGLSMDDLVQREGLYYQKFTDVPFTGEVADGLMKGSVKKGKKEGIWEKYFDSGQLNAKGRFKKGKEEGLWLLYFISGNLYCRCNYGNGTFDGQHERYFENGQLNAKGEFKDGKQVGSWVSYNYDGTINEKYTGTYKNGVKVSD